MSDLDQVVLKELMAQNRALTLLDVKKRNSSVTTTSGECSDEQETPAVSTPLADADDRLSDIASVIPAVDPEVVTLKHGAFLAQLLMDEVDLGEPTHGGSQDHAVFSMQTTDGPTSQVPAAKPLPNNMQVSWYDVQDPQQVKPFRTPVAIFGSLGKPVRTPVAILGSLGVCNYVPASRHWLILYSPFHLT